MYLRVVRTLIVLAATAIVAAFLFRPHRPALPISRVMDHPRDDIRLNRRLNHVAFDGVPRRSVVDSLYAMNGLNLATESLPEETWTAPVRLDLHEVSVEQLLRLIFDGRRLEDSEGDAMVLLDERYAVDPVYCFDVRSLVPPPARAVVAVSPPNPNNFMGEDWYGVDGIHPSPVGKALPDPSETQVLADRLSHAHLFGSADFRPEFVAELPGRLILDCTPHESRLIENALQQIRHPIALDAPPPGSLLDLRISRFEVSGTLATAIAQLRGLAGVNIAVRSRSVALPPIDLNGPASVSLTDTTLGDALDSVLSGSAIAAEEDNLIVIGNMDWEFDGAEFHAYDVRKILDAPIDLKVDEDPLLDTGEPDPITAMTDRESILLALIERHVGPVNFEFDMKANPQIWQGKLLLSAQHHYHRQLWKYLHDLAHPAIVNQPGR
jgi:hypothetical protein